MVIKTKRNLGAFEADFKQSEAYKRLNDGQREFFEHVFAGENVFLTGPAGTGKSYCIKTLFNYLASKGVFVGKAALTGVAALNIGGSTIHSWAGLGLADEDVDSVVRKAASNKKARERIQNTGMIFVDEVSMASADLMNKIDAVLKNVRMNAAPFGGMQVIFSGDFLQLPPVFKGRGDQLTFAFNSNAWNNANVRSNHLTKLVRQDDKTAFASALQRIRYGELTGSDLQLLESRVNARLDVPIDPIKIFCKNLDIDAYNQAKYSSLQTQEQVYICKDTGLEHYSKYFDKNCPAPPILRLKIGTQVMLLVNVDLEAGLVNGSIGVVDGFSPLGPIVKFTNGERSIIDQNKWEVKEQELDLTGKMRYKVVATRQQLPLKLAWATSVHKQQGCTLDHAVVDLSNAFEYGQVYVALSRVKTLEGLSIAGFNPRKIKAHPECLAFYEALNTKKS